MNGPLLLFFLLASTQDSPEPNGGTGANKTTAETARRFWTEPNQCAAWATYAVCRATGRAFNEQAIDRVLPADGRPKSLLEVRHALRTLGIESFGARFADKHLNG